MCGEYNLPEQGTWGEYADALDNEVDLRDGLTPPDAVAALHEAIVAYLNALLAFAEEQDRSTQFDNDEFWNVPNLLQLYSCH